MNEFRRKIAAESESKDWIARWRTIARRIRVPLGFVAAAVYLWRLFEAAPQPMAVAGSLLLVLPGLWLRGYAAGYVKKNQELTQTGPYAYTRNPLYLGSMLMAAGFAVTLMSVAFAAILLAGFVMIYVPVIAGEEEFLRNHFAAYEDYCRRVPRLLPRLLPRGQKTPWQVSHGVNAENANNEGGFSFALYRKHREYRAMLGALLLYASLVAARLLHMHRM